MRTYTHIDTDISPAERSLYTHHLSLAVGANELAGQFQTTGTAGHEHVLLRGVRACLRDRVRVA